MNVVRSYKLILGLSIELGNRPVQSTISARGRKDPSRFLERLRLLIDKIYNRTVLIEIIGGLRDHNGVSLLKQMLIDPTLTNGELVALACSLGMIGGEESIRILMQMQKICSPQEDELMQEIDIALRNNKLS